MKNMKIFLSAKPAPLEIDIDRTTLIVIDVQNCTVADGGMWHLAGANVSQFRTIINPVKKLSHALRDRGRRVVYITHCYSPDFRELGEPDSVLWERSSAHISYNEHPEWREKSLIRGTWGSEILEDIKPEPDDIIVEKSRYSGFCGTNLDTILRSLNTRYLLFVGILAHICVEATLRDAFSYGYYPVYVSDAVAAPTETVEQATIATVSTAYGWVTNSKIILDTLNV